MVQTKYSVRLDFIMNSNLANEKTQKADNKMFKPPV